MEVALYSRFVVVCLLSRCISCYFFGYLKCCSLSRIPSFYMVLGDAEVILAFVFWSYFLFFSFFFIMARICMILCNCSRTLVLISYSYFTCVCECVYGIIYNHFLPSDIHIYIHRHIHLSTSFCSFICLSVYLITFLHLYICACMDLHAHSIPIIYELAPKTSLPQWSNLALSFFSTLSFFQYITKGS